MREPLKILIVDDEPDLLRSICRILTLDGYEIDTASSLAGLLERENWSDYFAILLDRRLPDGTVDHALPEVTQSAPQAAIIIITAYADLDGALTALHNGAEDFFLKPVDPGHLRGRLKRLADQWISEQALRHERAFAQILLDTTRALIVVVDLEGKILRVNRHLTVRCGFESAELVGQPLLDTLVPPLSRKAARQYLDATHKEVYEQGSRFPLRSKSGQVFELTWWNGVLKDKQDRVVELVCVGLDMSDYDRLQQRLIQSERLAAIGEAMTGLAHESRNALQRSQACLDLLSDQLEDRPESIELLESIQRAQDDLYRLYEEVRAFAAPIHLQPRRCHIAQVMRETWGDLASRMIGRSVRLDEQIETENLFCDADPFALGQVFRNILENAMQACEDPVEIAIRYADALDSSEPALQVTIRDNGPGIEPKHAPQIFDSFFTTRTEGTGLGMAIAQRIVHAHRGQIDVNSQCEKGAEFIVTLPRTPS